MTNMDLSYAEGWRPEEGDVLVGTVTEVGVGFSNFGGNYPIVTVQPEERGAEPVAVHCFHVALQSRMLGLRPRVGERIGIKYEGQRPHKSQPGQTVAVYIVKIDGRTDTSEVWDRLSPSPPQVAAEEAGGFTLPQETLPAGSADDDIPF